MLIRLMVLSVILVVIMTLICWGIVARQKAVVAAIMQALGQGLHKEACP